MNPEQKPSTDAPKNPARGDMGTRGVTRGAHTMDEMNDEQRRQMLENHHRQTLWIWWTIVLLGAWLLSSPLTFDYGKGVMTPAEGRPVPFSLDTRIQCMFWNDLLSGLLLVVLGWRLLTPGRPRSQWGACFVGIWLQFAPLIFWAPSPLIYLNDTLVGVLVIALTILIPGMPWMPMIMKMGPEVPPGWSYNPSSWPQRGIMIFLGFAGWLVSRYLAAFQLGYMDHAWDPFFGDGSQRVLTSDVSEWWPISDAGLGAFSYTFEFLMAWMGSPARWRTMPWMVLFFGILVVPLGLTHIILVILQPVVVGEWCALCLLAALIMLPMIPLTLDEVVAMCQFMAHSVRDGKPFWRTFWKGDTIDGGGPDERSPNIGSFPQRPLAVYRAAIWGVSMPATLVLSALMGLWLMFSPALFKSVGSAASGDQFVGALIITIAVIAMAEVVRLGRWLNVLLGLWLAGAPWMLSGASTTSVINTMAVGIAVILLSIPRGRVIERYGSWSRWIR
ncbi:MAG TPA: vitamin K epoxide reductase family protein [Candidatus Binatia bacterium]|nr:vitamin K epoxide reductase family protein [Candidatus Binatia bacterium]